MGYKSDHPDRSPIPKQPTGIPGLDTILQGGIPCDRVTVFRGSHGCGKTVFGIRFLFNQASAGRPGVFVSFEEEANDVRKNAMAMGMDLAQLEADNKLRIVSLNIPPAMILNGDFNTEGSVAIVRQQAAEIGAQLLVLDAVDWLLSLFDSEETQKFNLQILHATIRKLGLTTVLSVKEDSLDSPLLNYMADCIIQLEQRMEGRVAARRLRVTKYRGSGFMGNEHPFVITNDAIRLHPISGAKLSHIALGEKISMGNEKLDGLLEGGVFKGSTSVILGASGTGKTTLASTFAVRAAGRGIRVLYLTFEDSVQSLEYTMRSAGLDLEHEVQRGFLRMESSLPESKGADLQIIELIDMLDEFAPEAVVIDALSSASRMGNREAVEDFQLRVLYLCKDRGITAILISQPAGTAFLQGSGDSLIVPLAETVIALDQAWNAPGFTRRLAIIKSRGANHATGMFAFRITSEGIQINSLVGTTGPKITASTRAPFEDVQ